MWPFSFPRSVLVVGGDEFIMGNCWSADCETYIYRAKDAVAALIKRLAHRNANVQLYTLEVCNPS